MFGYSIDSVRAGRWLAFIHVVGSSCTKFEPLIVFWRVLDMLVAELSQLKVVWKCKFSPSMQATRYSLLDSSTRDLAEISRYMQSDETS